MKAKFVNKGKKKATKPLEVSRDNAWDRQCWRMGMLGLSTNYIASETELTPGQVLYRLRWAEVKRADYRNGGKFTNIVLREASDAIDTALIRHLNKNL